MQSTNTLSIIQDLLETVENGEKGFSEAAQKLDDDGNAILAGEMRELSQQRLRMSGDLRAAAASEGTPIENGGGTIAGAIHRSYMAMRDALTGNDPHAVLAAAEQGEDHAMAEYEKALKEEMPAPIRAVVERQYEEVKDAHDRVRALRDSNE